MANQTVYEKNQPVYYRLVALWAFCEAFAGGLIHGIKLPFSGLLISSLAVTCIVLIAWYVPARGVIIRATVIVAVFKLMLSPHSPFTAYIAVFFQGLLAELIFSGRRHFRLSAVILAVLALVESSIQRILVLLIVFGNGFWKAINQYIQKLTGDETISNYSLMIAGGYVLIHAVIGIFIGVYASGLAKRSAGWQEKFPEFVIPPFNVDQHQHPASIKRKKVKLLFIITWSILLALMVQAYFFPGHSLISPNEVSGIFIRALLVFFGWYLFAGPLLMIVIKKVLNKQQQKNKKELLVVMQLLPQTKYYFIQSWQLSSIEKRFKRLNLFLKILLLNILKEAGEDSQG